MWRLDFLLFMVWGKARLIIFLYLIERGNIFVYFVVSLSVGFLYIL
ncbi:hypothetical protein ABID39_000613 [Bartonella japonica]|uniref:Uncharacterized protein n=1 Tax=Bartonella japonica TaxID=357761 RepID=A0ABV2FMZ6_9HYPH